MGLLIEAKGFWYQTYEETFHVWLTQLGGVLSE